MGKVSKKKMCDMGGGCGGVGYGLGFIGAFVYYLVATQGFWAGVVGFFKALVWPAFVVYELMTFLGI